MNGAPGVRAAALVADLPLGGGTDGLGFHIIGKPDPEPGTQFQSAFNIVSANYFRTMGIPIRTGREFNGADSDATPMVIVINETAAHKFWPGENPIGKQIGIDIPVNKTVLLTIVGITGDVREQDLGEAPGSEIFLNYMQRAPDWPNLSVVVRTAGDPADSASTIKDLAASVDRDIPVARVQTMDEVLSASLAEPSIYTWMLGIFASLALALAAVGLYGVVSYTAAQRTHEIGIRMALGAGRGTVLGLVLRQGVRMAGIGAAIGLVCAIGVNQMLIHLVPSVQPGDPLTLGAVAALLLSVAVAASFVPAWRATRIDPISALRNE
jgi:putative ABC transport system permease protein